MLINQLDVANHGFAHSQFRDIDLKTITITAASKLRAFFEA